MISLRSSSSDRVLHCSGSITLVPLVNPRDGDEGEEGVYLHWLSHARMRDEMGAVGDIGPEPFRPKSVNASEWIAGFYFKAAQDLIPQGWSLESEMALEYQFPLRKPYIETDADGEQITVTHFSESGHPDDVGISPDGKEAIGLDLKCGYDPVDPADQNEQVFTYAVLLLEAYPDLEKITYYIIQPRNDEDEGFRRISEPMVLEGERLRSARATWLARMNDAIENRYEVNTGRKACKWCPAAIQCPAAIELREFMKAQLTPELLATIKATPDDAVLGDWVISARTLNRPIEDAEKLLDARLETVGTVIAGDGTPISLKIEGGGYSVPDGIEFLSAFRTLLPTDASLTRCYKPSMTKIKDEIVEVKGVKRTSKKDAITAETLFDGVLRPLVVQGVRKKKVFG